MKMEYNKRMEEETNNGNRQTISVKTMHLILYIYVHGCISYSFIQYKFFLLISFCFITFISLINKMPAMAAGAYHFPLICINEKEFFEALTGTRIKELLNDLYYFVEVTEKHGVHIRKYKIHIGMVPL